RIAARRETGEWRSIAQKRAERFSYKLASVIVGNSNAVRDRLIAEGVSCDRIVTIHNGVDLNRVATQEERDAGTGRRGERAKGRRGEPGGRRRGDAEQREDEFDRRRVISSFGLPSNSKLKFVTIVANMRHEVKDHRTFLRAARLVLESNPSAR